MGMNRLNRSFPKRLRAENECSIVILQRTCHDFGSAGTPFVNEHRHFEFELPI